jgi:hypothetical protein
VQITDGNFWSFGTIEAWDASIALVNLGNFGEAKVELAAIRQYRSAKQCSSIQHGTESSLHSCSHKRKPLPTVLDVDLLLSLLDPRVCYPIHCDDFASLFPPSCLPMDMSLDVSLLPSSFS